MKSSDSNSKGGEGRGLPRRWGWREDEDGFAFRLYPPGCGSLDYSAVAYRDGSFVAYRDARGSEEIASEDRDDPRTPDTIAAAQAAAEAALWRCDGFGVGEVRGRLVDALDTVKPFMVFPGLDGLWRVTKTRVTPEGVEVDAVRAPVPARCPACGAILPATGIGCESCGWMGEPLPGDDERAPVEPATREPSVPTDDDELARLLRGPDGARLDDDIATVRNHAPEIWSGTREHVLRVARACELLLAERERMAARVLAMTEDRAEAAERHVERAMKDGATAVAGWTKTGKDLEAARARIAELSATPPPHTVAALLARVEEARRGAATKASNTVGASGANFQDGKAAGLREALRLIRATLTHSPLDGVVAEVLACDLAADLAEVEPMKPADYINEIRSVLDNEENDPRTALLYAGNLALAGMLACDAAKGGA